ncbi:hypothetical protein AB1Y20_011873 [Prymnesium parvum]|uniref:Uncharacterized protein n=1 Tax=Prymnesium parvum TaxID=97485 RepID=A0AB34IL30_PRYPA
MSSAAAPKTTTRQRLQRVVVAQQPRYVERNLSLVQGARHTRRPSSMARKSGKRRSSDVMKADEFAGNRESWATSEQMPEEAKDEDGGWRAGPIVRELPAFNGPTPGPTNENLKHDSPEVEFMKEFFTTEFKVKCQQYTWR